MSTEILEKAKKIKLAGFDVDGVLTDGTIYFANSGEEMRAFNTQDGLGMKLLLDAGIEVAIITAKTSELLARRCKELNIVHLYQGQFDKMDAFNEILDILELSPEQAAFTGDDLPDLPLIEKAGLGISVANARPEVIAASDWQTQHSGGHGAVREICDLLLRAQQI